MHPIQRRLEVTYGSEARDRRVQARSPGGEGARVALETFYYAFRTRSRAVLSEVSVGHRPFLAHCRGEEPCRELEVSSALIGWIAPATQASGMDDTSVSGDRVLMIEP